MIPLRCKDPWLGVILACALLARLIFYIVYPDVFFPDATAYLAIGEEIFSGQIITNDKYMPLYPIWTYLTGGGVGLRLADIFLSVGIVFLIYHLVLALFGDRLVGLVASGIAALYPHFLFYAVTGLTETAYTLLLLISFWLFYRGKIFSGAVISVCAILIRPTLDLYNPILVLVFSLFVYRDQWRRAIKCVGIYLLVYGVVMAPWWVHQYSKYETFVRLNLGVGEVLYLGNNPLNRTGGGLGGKGKDGDLELFSEIKDPLQRNAALKQVAIDYIVEDPGRFIKSAGVKFIRFWRLFPHTNYYQQWYVILTSLLSYGVVLLLSIGFLVRSGGKCFRRLLPIFGLIAYLTLVHVVTIGSIRYRFPLEPFLIIFAAHFVVTEGKNLSLIRKLKERITLT